MVDEKAMRDAKKVFQTICESLDDHDWKYDRNDEKLVISTGARGDDLPMAISIRVDAERQLVVLHSPMAPKEFTVPENMRKEMAVAVACANRGMVHGTFDYDYVSGEIWFRLACSYRGSVMAKGVFDYMVGVSCSTIDDYNDKFLAVIKMGMSNSEIMNFIK